MANQNEKILTAKQWLMLLTASVRSCKLFKHMSILDTEIF